MSAREEYEKACQMMAWEYGTVEEGSQRVAAEQMGIITAYVTSLEQERDELKKLINESPKVWLDSSSYRDPLNSRLTFMRVYEEEQSPTSDAPFRYAMVMLDEKRPRVADLDEEGFDL